MKPLLEEYVASTREPVAPSQLFGPAPSAASRGAPQPRRDDTRLAAPTSDRSLLALLAGLFALLAAAGVVLLAA